MDYEKKKKVSVILVWFLCCRDNIAKCIVVVVMELVKRIKVNDVGNV